MHSLSNDTANGNLEPQSPTSFAGGFPELGILSGDGETGIISGTPEADAQDWVHQTTPFTCDVVSQEMILHEFGMDVSEAQLVYDAASHHWLTDGGTSAHDMSQLLELHGVHTHTVNGGSIESLTNELAHGHKVIVAVDSGELWNQNGPFYSLFHSAQADHAVVLTGLDMSDPKHPKVVINDPGDPKGAGKPYPLDQFLEAWSGSGNMYVATDNAPPHLVNNLVLGANFHPDLGIYMDAGFWMDFLKGISLAVIRTVAKTVLPSSADNSTVEPGAQGLF